MLLFKYYIILGIETELTLVVVFILVKEVVKYFTKECGAQLVILQLIDVLFFFKKVVEKYEKPEKNGGTILYV